MLSHQIKQEKIGETRDFISQFTKNQLQQHLDQSVFSSENVSEVSEQLSVFFDEIKTHDVLRIKIWGADAQVIYSDKSELIGQRFPDNEEYAEAMAGETVAEIKAPLDREHVFESGYAQLMEVYVPAQFSDGAIKGVIEVYYKMDTLNGTIARLQKTLWYIISLGFLLLYASLFFYVKKASDRLMNQTVELQSSAKKLEEHSKTLEKKVEERTIELKEKMLEMEKFNRLATGRELRMAELKKRIKELEEMLPGPKQGSQ